ADAARQNSWERPATFTSGTALRSAQLSTTCRPVLKPPASCARETRPLKVTSMPLYRSAIFAILEELVTSCWLCPNFDGITSYNPQSLLPPTADGSAGSTGTCTQYSVKSAADTERLSV